MNVQLEERHVWQLSQFSVHGPRCTRAEVIWDFYFVLGNHEKAVSICLPFNYFSNVIQKLWRDILSTSSFVLMGCVRKYLKIFQHYEYQKFSATPSYSFVAIFFTGRFGWNRIPWQWHCAEDWHCSSKRSLMSGIELCEDSVVQWTYMPLLE
jgi:hypothetical protein